MTTANHRTTAARRAPLFGYPENERSAEQVFSLTLYLLIVFALSWPFLIVSALWAKSLAWSYLLNSAGMLMVTVGTLLAGKGLFRHHFAGAGWSWGQRQHYGELLALVGLLWLSPLAINLAMGNLQLPLHIDHANLHWIVLFLVGTLLPSLGEEFGWRGYLLPRLAQRMSPRRAVLLHALIWWVWHWPALIGAAVQMVNSGNPTDLSGNRLIASTLLLVINALPTILHGIIFAWLWARTQSLAVVTVYHALYDGLRDSLAITIHPNLIGTNTLAELWPTVMICLLGLLLLWRGNWQILATQQGAKA